MKYKVILVGKIREAYYTQAAQEYIKRLMPYVSVQLLQVKNEEAAMAKVSDSTYLFALCVEGQQLTSEKFSQKLSDVCAMPGKKNICFIIGGADGLSPQVKDKANMRLSLSEMTFPHRLAAVMLLEQLYRAAGIQNNSKYHK